MVEEKKTGKTEELSLEGMEPEVPSGYEQVKIGLLARYDTKEVVSTMVKELRKGDEDAAMYWAYILYITRGYVVTLRYLYMFAAEDLDDLEFITCIGQMVHLVSGERKKWLQDIHFIDQAVVRYCSAPKKWETERGHLMEELAERNMEEVKKVARGEVSPRPIPSYALDRHTKAGWALKKMGIDFDHRLSGSWEGVRLRREQIKENGELPFVDDKGKTDKIFREVSESYKKQQAF